MAFFYSGGSRFADTLRSAEQPPPRWTRFEDPNEHAFTLEVPQGWTVRAAFSASGYSDTRPMLDLTSPDGKTNIRFGDVAIPSYSVPNQSHSREGEPYDLGAQAQLTVARYRSGQDFAQLYAIQRFLRLCQKLEPQAASGEPPVHDYVPPGAPSPSQSSGGQVSYRCDTSQGPRIAYAYAKTALFGSLWQVTSLASFLAPVGRSPGSAQYPSARVANFSADPAVDRAPEADGRRGPAIPARPPAAAPLRARPAGAAV